MRRIVAPIELATALARDVLPTPGTSSMSRWPSQNMHTSAARTTSGLPRTKDSTLRASASYRPANHSTWVALPLPLGSVALTVTSMRPRGPAKPREDSRFGTGRSPGVGARSRRHIGGGMRDHCCDDMTTHLQVGDVPGAAAAPGRHVVYDSVFDEYCLVREGGLDAAPSPTARGAGRGCPTRSGTPGSRRWTPAVSARTTRASTRRSAPTPGGRGRSPRRLTPRRCD